tara:strand:+ start:913 stop:1230 length:318 start_codon:yes stop_codon:yes gene_type:complete
VSKNATQSEIQKRLGIYLQWHQQGLSRLEQCQLASKKWGISYRQSDRYRKALFDELKKDLKMDRSDKVATVVSQLEHICKLSIENRQLSNAIGAINSISRLLKLE